MSGDQELFTPSFNNLETLDGKPARPYLVVWEAESGYDRVALAICQQLSALKLGVLGLVAAPGVKGNTVDSYADSLARACVSKGIRHGHVIGFAEACPVVQGLAVKHRKLPRTLALVDPVLRPHATIAARVIGAIEGLLPLGLPLRSPDSVVDVAHLLHRIRVPTAICSLADYQGGNDIALLSHRLPVAWWTKIAGGVKDESTSNKLVELLLTLATAPLKCPQVR